MTLTLAGVFVPLITPFDADGGVALGALENLAREVLEAGASGIIALGTTAEPASLSPAEQRAVVEVVARVCRAHDAADGGRPHLLVGANTIEALATLRGRAADVTAALTLVPPFVRPGEAGVIAHFAALAKASPVPLVVYHVPYRTGQHLTTEAIRRLAALPGIVGIKHAVGGIDAETIALLADPPTGLAVLGGDDPFIAPMLALGAHGGILASAHVATARFVELVEAWRAGDAVRARELGHPLAALSSALFAEPNPTVIKGVLHEHGRIPTAAVRLPLLPAGAATVQTASRLAAAATTIRHSSTSDRQSTPQPGDAVARQPATL